MATRLQIARARARVALARRTGETVSDETLALSKIDLSNAEKAPRAWERVPGEAPLQASGPSESPDSNDRSDQARVDRARVRVDGLHEQLVEQIGRDNDGTIRAVEEIIGGVTRSTDSCSILPLGVSMDLHDHHGDDSFDSHAVWRWGAEPLLFTYHGGGRDRSIGGGLFKRHRSRTLHGAPPELNVIVIRTEKQAEDGGAGASASAGSEPSRA